MKLSWRVELLQIFIIAAMFVVAATAWSHAPDRFPVHWNAAGEVDRWGGKFEGLLALPLVTLGIYLLIIILPLFDPGRRNYANFAGAFNAIRISIVVFMAALYGVMVLIAFGYKLDMTTVVLLLMGALFIVLGNYLGKIRPNWFVGVRTPWTLSSKRSWDKTHRLAGWLFVFMGLLSVAAALIPSGWTILALVVIDALCLLWIVVYSYLVYRKDPERVTPAGISPSNE